MAGGVYQIRNLLNGDRYIGRSVNFRQRWHAHRSYLKRGAYKLPYLQNAWNAYGEAAFAFEPLIECSPETAVIIEQLFLDGKVGKYNVSKSALTPVRAGDTVSVETRAKISASLKGKNLGRTRPDNAARNRSSEWRARTSARLRGKPKPYAQGRPRPAATCEKLKIALAKARAVQAAKRLADPDYAALLDRNLAAARAARKARREADGRP